MTLTFDHLGMDSWSLFVFVLLAVVYLIIGVVAAALLLVHCRRTQRNGPTSTSRQISTFYLSISVGCLVRSAYFGMTPLIDGAVIVLRQPPFFFINTISEYFFFSTYLILLYFWVEIYYNATAKAQGVEGRNYRTGFHGVNIFMYLVVGTCYIVDCVLNWNLIYLPTNVATKPEKVILLFGSFLFILTALFFLAYGAGLYTALESLGRHSAVRAKLLSKVGYSSAIITVCFTARSIMKAIPVFDPDLNLNSTYTLFYFLLTEVWPILMMMYLLRYKGNRAPAAGDAESSPLVEGPMTPQVGYASARF